MSMLGFSEILVIVSVVVIALGWRRLPQVGSSLRKTLIGFRSGLQGSEEKKLTRDVQECDDKNLSSQKNSDTSPRE